MAKIDWAKIDHKYCYGCLKDFEHEELTPIAYYAFSNGVPSKYACQLCLNLPAIADMYKKLVLEKFHG